MDTNSLKPIKVILRGTTQLPSEHVRSVLTAILSDPVPLSAAPVDIQEFVSTVLSCDRQLSSTSDWDIVCQSVEKVAMYVQAKDKVVATSVSDALVEFFARSSLSSLSDEAISKLVSLFSSELSKHNRELTLRICSSFINSVESSHALLLKPLLESLISLREQSSNFSAT